MRAFDKTARSLCVPLVLWWRLYRQLRLRSAGRRESGAFLLGDRGADGFDRIRQFICYDDLDPNSLSKGYVDFSSRGFANLWAECRQLQLDVLADVHSHPGDSSQSETDRTHPMITEAGHVGLIVPRYAKGWAFRFSAVSVYEYEGNYCWQDWSGELRKDRLRFTWW